MNRLLILVAMLSGGAAMAAGMVGGPVFCLGEHKTSMTVEVSKINMDVMSYNETGNSNLKESFTSKRLFLVGRYGVTQFLDVEGRVGTADLRFSDSPDGYSNFETGMNVAWGTGLRLALPTGQSPYQLTASASYVGYRAEGNAIKGQKKVSSKYIWQEVSPSLTFGYQVGKFVPYLGVTKPYLFGSRDVNVTFNGQQFPAAGGNDSYTDGKQDFRGILGLEWKLPEGYSINTEVASTQDGLWMMFIGIAQVLK